MEKFYYKKMKIRERVFGLFIIFNLIATPSFSLRIDNPNEQINVDVSGMEIGDAAKMIADLIGKNIVVNPEVSGKLQVYFPKTVTKKQAYDAFLAALNGNGLTIIEKEDDLLQIVRTTDTKSKPIPITEGTIAKNDQYITRLVKVNYIKAKELKDTLSPMLSDPQNILAYESTNTLMITDTANNIARLMKIIESLDVKGFKERLEFIKLNNAPAKDIAENISNILSIDKGRGAGAYYGGSFRPGGTGAGDKEQVISNIIADDRTNSIIVKGNDKGIEEIRELVAKLDTDTVDQKKAVKIFLYHLDHADALKISETLSSILSNVSKGYRPFSYGGPSASPYSQTSFSGRTDESAGLAGIGEVKIAADEKTNSLIILSTREAYEMLLPTIKGLDMKKKQVHIAASIMEILLNDGFDFGAVGHGGWQNSGKNITAFGGTQFNNLSSASMYENPAAQLGNLYGLAAGIMSSPINLGKGFQIPGFGAMLKAQKFVRDSKVLSQPSILTLDNQEAAIEVGQTISIQTSQTAPADKTGLPTIQYTREKATLRLVIKPKINKSGDVTMEIKQEINDIAPDTEKSATPAFLTRNTNTTVMARTEETIVLGGLMQDRIGHTISKVPLLGDIPVLGYLFKNKSKTVTKTNLLLFITPTVLESSKDVDKVNAMVVEKRKRFYDRAKVEADDWIGSDERNTHPAGVTIKYGKNKAKENDTIHFDNFEGSGIYEFPVK